MVTDAFAGGVYEWLKMVCPALVRRGFRVGVVYWRRPESPPPETLAADFPGSDLDDFGPGASPNPIRMAGRLLRLLEQRRPDIVHLHSSWAGLAGRLALSGRRRRGGGPAAVYYTPHAYGFLRQDLNPAMRAAVWLAEKTLARAAGTVVVACGPGETKLAKGLGSRVIEIPNGIESLPSGPPREAQGGSAGAGPGGALVLSGGRLAPQKDPLFALAAASRILREHPLARFVWVGDGPLARAASAYLGRMEPAVAGRMRLSPHVERDTFRALLAGASVYLHTARWEGLSLALLEAMAAGTPIVVRRGPGCHEVVEQARAGLVIDDPASAAQAAGRVLGDRDLAADLGRAGQAAVRDRFSLERLIAGLVDLYSGGDTVARA